MEPERTRVLVLNYNGRDLLAECLPSLVEAARRSPIPCALTVVDNGSADGSIEYLSAAWPEVEVVREPNRGLASFNAVLARVDEPIVLLLNNDVKLDRDAIGPLLDALVTNENCLFAAPLCWTFDGREYEGMRTRVRTRFGLVQGMSRVPGFERHVHRPDRTAAAGPVLAVDRRKFLALGGYDPVYFPGRIEDLDLAYRGWMAGWAGLYVPASVAYHKGFGSFGPAFGRSGCDTLAARNTMIFAWKNLSGRRLAAHLAWLPARAMHAALTGRLGFLRAIIGALTLLPAAIRARKAQRAGRGDWNGRQEAFFRRFAW